MSKFTNGWGTLWGFFKQTTKPGSPPSTYNKLYFKSDNKLYTLGSDGTERTNLADGDTVSSLTITTLSTSGAVSGTIPAMTNPKAMSQGVNMTAAAAGSSGITVADNDNIDFGTGNFTLVWNGSVPDYTPAADVILMQKTDATNGWLLQIDTTGVLQLLRNAEAAKSSTAAPSITDGTEHEIVCVVTTETAAVAGSVAFYVDGVQLGSSVTITAGAPTTVSNAVSLYVAGTSAVRSASVNKTAYTFNRALTAAEVLDLYRNGIAESDKWGSQTELLTNGDCELNANWSAIGGPTTSERSNTFAHSGTFSWKTVTNAAGGGVRNADIANIIAGRYLQAYVWIYPVTAGTLTVSLSNGDDSAWIQQPNFVTGVDLTLNTWNKVKVGGLNTVTGTSSIFQVTHGSAAATFYIDDATITYSGATLALEPEGIQISSWQDSSSNGLDATYPTTGYSFTRKFYTGGEILLNSLNVTLAADGEQAIYTVPTGVRAILTKAILVVGADANSTDFTIGADGAETDWLGTQQCDNLNAANDVGIFMPVPNAVAVLQKSYAAGTVIKFTVANHAGGATNTLMLFGILY